MKYYLFFAVVTALWHYGLVTMPAMTLANKKKPGCLQYPLLGSIFSILVTVVIAPITFFLTMFYTQELIEKCSEQLVNSSKK